MQISFQLNKYNTYIVSKIGKYEVQFVLFEQQTMSKHLFTKNSFKLRKGHHRIFAPNKFHQTYHSWVREPQNLYL